MCAIAGQTCVGDAGLNLRGSLPRGAVGRDLVQSVGGHFGGFESLVEVVKVRRVAATLDFESVGSKRDASLLSPLA